MSVRLLGLLLLAALVLAAVLFVPAGRLDWWEGWLYLGLVMGGSLVLMAVVMRADPELAHRRLKEGEGTPGWDRLMLVLLKLGFLGGLVLAGLSAGRWGEGLLPVWLVPVGALLLEVGIALLGWAMLANTHFETTVRVQHDRRHRVVDTGPYRLVRHPGYAAALFLSVGSPLVLRSGWAFLPFALAIGVLAVRAVLEERLLRHELDGYTDYARRVRYRFVPGIW